MTTSSRNLTVLEGLEPRRLLSQFVGPLPYGEPPAGRAQLASIGPLATLNAGGYSVRVKDRAYAGTKTKVELLPTPAGSTFPAGMAITLTPSDGSGTTVLRPDADGGAEYFYIPARAGSVTISFSNGSGLANAAPVAMTIHPGIDSGGHIPPPRTGGTQFTSPGTEYLIGIINAYRRSRNVFLTGEAVQFLIPGQWTRFNLPVTTTSYEVRNFEGLIVDAGSIAHSSAQHTLLTLNVTEPGWYRLYLFDSARNHAVTGDAIGEALFSIWDADPNLPTPGLTSYNNGADFPDSVAPLVVAEDFNTAFVAGNDPLYLRKSGKIVPPTSGTWIFEPQFGALARLTVNGKVIFDQWHTNYRTSTPSSIGLTGGQEYSFMYEAYVAPATTLHWLYWRKEGTSNAPIPTSAQRDDSGTPGVMTARYYTGYHSKQSANDQYLRALTGNATGVQRIGVLRGQTFADHRPEIQIFKDLQRNRDPNRPKLRLDIAFPDYGTANTNTLAEVTAFVQSLLSFGLTADDFVVECTNEPNLSMSASAFATNVLPGFYNAVKAVNPAIRVIGPATVALQPADLNWIQQFINAGGAAYLNGFSFHHYNGTQGDFHTARKSLGGLKTLLANNNLGHLELYQTEQGDFTAMYGLFAMRHGVRWTMTRALIYEQEGLPMERNHYWYDRSHGFWDFPMFLNNGHGGLMPQATAFRVFGRELFGKVHSQKFSFGASLDNIYAGSLFSGPSGSVAMFMTAGDAEGQVRLSVSGASSLTVVSWEGKTSTLPIQNGRAVLPVSDFPVYVRIPLGASLTIVGEQLGTNLARSATASASKGEIDIAKVNNGDFENWYHGFDNTKRVWLSTADLWLEDAWVELRWNSPQTLDRVNIFAPAMWQGEGSLLDYELQYHNGSNWVTIDHVVEPLSVVLAYQMGSRSTVDDYSRNRNIFQHSFDDVTTDRIRVLAHIATFGGASVETVHEAGGQAWGFPRFMIRELEAYNAMPDDKTYVGPEGGSWSDAANWSPVGVPTVRDVAVIGDRDVKLTAAARVAGLSIAQGGSLDLNGYDLLVDYQSVGPLDYWDGTGYTGLSGLIARGALRSSENWSGISRVAVVEACDLLGLTATQTALWAGQTVDGSCVLVRFTYGGDTNLDRRINVDDYGGIDAALGQIPPIRGYFHGDFNLDGRVNIDDYSILDFNFRAQP